MKPIEFYDLPRAVQERFISASQASLAPAPLAVKVATGYVGRDWFLGALAAFAVTIGIALLGFGDLDHAGAIASGARAGLYCVGFSVSFACLSRGLTLRDRALSLPFTRGTYLFPVGVIEAVSSTLRLHPLSEVEAVEPAEQAFVLRFADGTRFEFPAASREQAELARDAVTQANERLSEARREQSLRDLAALDPLCQTNFPSPFSTGVPFKRPTAAWTIALHAMAIISGSALGVGIWKVRNMMSETRIAAEAHRRGDTEAFRAYLARGGARPEIAAVFLPRAELADAVAEGSVAAIERYIESHPNSEIQAEVERALKQALLRELEHAKAAGTLAALAEFKQRFPRHEQVAAELAQARHEVYERAAERAATLAVERTGRENPAAFVRRLTAYVEQHGPKVEVRFRNRLNKAARRADTLVRQSPYFGGQATVPSQYFDGERQRSRQELAAQLLVEALQTLFAPELVRFEVGEPIAAIDAEDELTKLPEPSVPTLYIDHLTELSGAQTIAKPRGIFMGASMFFYTDFVIPGDSDRLSFKVSTWRSPDRRVMTAKTRTVADVYEDLARRSFSLFLKRYLALVLDDPPAAALPRLVLPELEEGADEKG